MFILALHISPQYSPASGTPSDNTLNSLDKQTPSRLKLSIDTINLCATIPKSLPYRVRYGNITLHTSTRTMPQLSKQLIRTCGNGLVSVMTCGAALPSTVPLTVQKTEAKMLKSSVMHDVRILQGTARRTLYTKAGQAVMGEASNYSSSIQTLAQKLQGVRTQLAATQAKRKQLT